MSTDLETWWSQGRHRAVPVGGSDHDVFVWASGADDAPIVTLLHGWPTSSWDWAGVVPALTDRHRVLAPDLLGLGASAKGDDVPYDIVSQADMVEALWRLDGVTRTRLVAHDVGTIVAQELLARVLEGRCAVSITDVVWLNGSLDPSAYRPTPAQEALADPVLGPQLVALIGEDSFAEGLAAVHGVAPDPAHLHQHWLAMSRDEGHLGTPRFLGYIAERAAAADRLLGAVRDAEVPMRFVWGLADPVSGAAQLDAIRAVRPDADVIALPDVGHYPHTEATEAVIAAITG